MTHYPIFVLEGADSSGKTTLARAVVRRTGASTLHSIPFERCVEAHDEILCAAMRLSRHQAVIVDRHWVSEQVYGPAVRGRAQYRGPRLDRNWRAIGARFVLCVPGDRVKHLARWRCDRDAGKPEYPDESTIGRIVDAYRGLRFGDPAWTGSTHVDCLIRAGGIADRPDVVVYDLDVDGRDLDGFVDGLLDGSGVR